MILKERIRTYLARAGSQLAACSYTGDFDIKTRLIGYVCIPAFEWPYQHLHQHLDEEKKSSSINWHLDGVDEASHPACVNDVASLTENGTSKTLASVFTNNVFPISNARDTQLILLRVNLMRTRSCGTTKSKVRKIRSRKCTEFLIHTSPKHYFFRIVGFAAQSWRILRLAAA